MTSIQIIFYLFATVAVAAGVMVVAAKNSVHSVLFLVLAFFAMAGIWILLNAEFLALILVLVYVGAVMTLFLFVVMMLNIDNEVKREGFVRYFPIAAFIVVLVVGLIVMVVGPERFGLTQAPLPAPFPADYSNTSDLGSVLYTNYAYPFEVAGVLLLTAIIAAITLTHRPPKQRKVQNIAKQIAVKRDQRVKLINMPSEKKIRPGVIGDENTGGSNP
ncbi:MAG: NADH-quinone oxidoreductase subunit J [Gammaproteobacteria bacterium]